MSKASNKIYEQQITVDGELYDYHVSQDCIVIREATGKNGEKRGWKHFKKFPKKDAAAAQDAWKKLYARRYVTTAVAVVEKGKCNTMLQMQDVATHINEKYERFQTVEKEATMLMLEIGLAMEYVKENSPHGQLGNWIEANLTISRMHAHRFRQLAQVFIKFNNLKPDECLLLCDPANSKEALGEKLRQMAFDFLGDKTQAELFEQYKIKYQEAAKPGDRPLHLPKPKPLDPGETQAHRTATELIYPMMAEMHKWLISDRRMVQHLDMKELKVLQGDLIDAKRIVDGLIKAG